MALAVVLVGPPVPLFAKTEVAYAVILSRDVVRTALPERLKFKVSELPLVTLNPVSRKPLQKSVKCGLRRRSISASYAACSESDRMT